MDEEPVKPIRWQPVEPEPIAGQPRQKWWILVAAAILVIIGLALYLNRGATPTEVHQQATEARRDTTPPSQPQTGQQQVQQSRRIGFALSGSLKSKTAVPLLLLKENISNVDLAIPVPHSSTTEGYLVQLVSPANDRYTLARSARVITTPAKANLVRVAVARGWLELDGRYNVSVKEVPKARLKKSAPKTYRYEFEVKRK